MYFSTFIQVVKLKIYLVSLYSDGYVLSRLMIQIAHACKAWLFFCLSAPLYHATLGFLPSINVNSKPCVYSICYVCTVYCVCTVNKSFHHGTLVHQCCVFACCFESAWLLIQFISILFKAPFHHSVISRHFTCLNGKTARRAKLHTESVTGDSGGEKPPFNRQKPPGEPDSV